MGGGSNETLFSNNEENDYEEALQRWKIGNKEFSAHFQCLVIVHNE